MTSQPDNSSSVPRKLQLRRAPKYVPFLILGGLLGLVAAAILAFSFTPGEEFDSSSVFGLFAVLLVLPGMGVGAMVALLLDRRGRRKSTTLLVEPLPEDGSDAESERA